MKNFIKILFLCSITFLVQACSKNSDEISPVKDLSSSPNQSGSVNSREQEPCEDEPDCVLEIFQYGSTSVSTQWVLDADIIFDETTECQTCWSGNNQFFCPEIGVFNPADFPYYRSSIRYDFYYSGPTPRSFLITNGCNAITIHATSMGYIGSIDSDDLDICVATNPCQI